MSACAASPAPLCLPPPLPTACVPQIVAYEAGFHGIGDGSDTDLAIQASLDPRMEEVYTRYLTALADEGVTLIGQFVSVSKYSRYGSFGLKMASDQVRAGAGALRGLRSCGCVSCVHGSRLFP